MLREIPGILPAKMYEGCTRNAYHLYMFRYKKEHFADMPRSKFMAALGKEGVGCSGGYGPMNKSEYVLNLPKSRHYQKLYPAEVLKNWAERNQCPMNDQLCQEAVWFTQNMLLGPRTDMDKIAEAIRRLQKHAGEVAKV